MITTAIAAVVAAHTYYSQLPADVRIATQADVQLAIEEPLQLAKITRADQLREAISRNEHKLDQLLDAKKPNKSRIRRLEKTIQKQKKALCKLDKTECD